MSIRDEIAELGREQDALLSEHQQWMARREATSASPVRKSDPAGGLLYRVRETPLPAAPQPALDASAENGGSDTDWRIEVAEAIGDVAWHVKKEMRQEVAGELLKRDRKIAELEGELREIRGMLGATLTLLGSDIGGKQTKSVLAEKPARSDDDSVVDLPDWRRSHGA